MLIPGQQNTSIINGINTEDVKDAAMEVVMSGPDGTKSSTESNAAMRVTLGNLKWCMDAEDWWRLKWRNTDGGVGTTLK